MRKRGSAILSMILTLFLTMTGTSFAAEEPSDIEKLAKALNAGFSFKVSEADLVKLLQKGFGFNRIVKVYIMAAKSGKSPEEVVKLWEKTGSIGTMIKELGLKLTSGDLRKKAIAILRKAGIEEHGEGQGQGQGPHGQQEQGHGEKHQQGERKNGCSSQRG